MEKMFCTLFSVTKVSKKVGMPVELIEPYANPMMPSAMEELCEEHVKSSVLYVMAMKEALAWAAEDHPTAPIVTGATRIGPKNPEKSPYVTPLTATASWYELDTGRENPAEATVWQEHQGTALEELTNAMPVRFPL